MDGGDGGAAVVQVALSATDRCLRRADGSLSCAVQKLTVEMPVTAHAVELCGDCARMDDGTVTCWSAPPPGWVDPSRAPPTRPWSVPGLQQVAQLTCNDSNTCARTQEGRVLCWTHYYQFGDAPAGATHPLPVELQAAAPAVDVAIGAMHGCVVRPEGSVACWRRSNGPFAGTLQPVPRISDAVGVVPGESHACARRRDGGVSCWGFPPPPDGDANRRAGPAEWPRVPVDLPPLRGARAIVAGERFVCGIVPGDRVRCVGAFEQRTAGPLVRHDTPRGPYFSRDRLEYRVLPPVDVPGLSAPRFLRQHGEFVNVLQADGWERSWAPNLKGEPRGPTRPYLFMPGAQAVSLFREVDDRLRSEDWCAHYVGGAVRCRHWSGGSTFLPGRVISELPPVVDVALGGGHGCAIDHITRVWCWGGQRAWALRVTGLTGADGLALGGDFACARIAGGGVRCWGDGTEDRPAAPGSAVIPRGVAQITAGSAHACARMDDGTVRCWGWNAQGQLGDGTRSDSAEPRPVSGLGGVLQVAAGGMHTCALVAGGKVRCWGDNTDRQVGPAAGVFALAPTEVPRVEGAVQISAALDHTCARLGTGQVHCWGSAPWIPAPQSGVPQRVAAFDGAVDISSGGSSTCAVRPGGARSCQSPSAE